MTVRVLLIDDDRDLREIARMALEIVGKMEVLTAATAEEAIEQARSAQVDVILLDLLMPDLGGREIFAALRALPEARTTPVIFMTGWHDRVEHDRLRAIGAAAVISKPFDPMGLAARIRSVLEGAADVR